MRRRQSSTRRKAAADAPGPAFPPARRRFGQNFLVDPAAIRRIVTALAPRPDETVVEIGPGRGALTEALLAAGGAVTAIEIDRALAAALIARGHARLSVVEADVLTVPLRSLGTALAIAGNLPYNISKPVAMKLVVERACVARAVLMFQREVADRLVATPGTAAYGPLSVLAGRAFAIERLFDLPPGAFRPRPKVVSTVTRWTPRPPGALPDELVAPLMEVLRAAFARRRQTLLKNLRAATGDEGRARELLAAAGIDGALRAEAVSPDRFVALAQAWP